MSGKVRPEVLERFRANTADPVLRAMRKLGRERGPALTLEEHHALDAWLDDRLELTIDAILHEGMIAGRHGRHRKELG